MTAASSMRAAGASRSGAGTRARMPLLRVFVAALCACAPATAADAAAGTAAVVSSAAELQTSMSNATISHIVVSAHLDLTLLQPASALDGVLLAPGAGLRSVQGYCPDRVPPQLAANLLEMPAGLNGCVLTHSWTLLRLDSPLLLLRLYLRLLRATPAALDPPTPIVVVNPGGVLYMLEAVVQGDGVSCMGVSLMGKALVHGSTLANLSADSGAAVFAAQKRLPPSVFFNSSRLLSVESRSSYASGAVHLRTAVARFEATSFEGVVGKYVYGENAVSVVVLDAQTRSAAGGNIEASETALPLTFVTADDAWLLDTQRTLPDPLGARGPQLPGEATAPSPDIVVVPGSQAAGDLPILPVVAGVVAGVATFCVLVCVACWHVQRRKHLYSDGSFRQETVSWRAGAGRGKAVSGGTSVLLGTTSNMYVPSVPPSQSDMLSSATAAPGSAATRSAAGASAAATAVPTNTLSTLPDVSLLNSRLLEQVPAAELQALQESLTAMEDGKRLLYRRFVVLPDVAGQRRQHSTGLLQVVRAADGSDASFLVKFFLNREAFRCEARVLRDKRLSRMLYASSEVHDDVVDVERSPLKYVFPPATVIPRPSHSLQQWCATAARTRGAVARVMADVVERLAALHSHHLVHRDIRPDHIVQIRDDWTLVKWDHTERVGHLAPIAHSMSYVQFAAPEVVRAYEQKRSMVTVATATDMWSLGVVLLEVLTGRPAFPFPTSLEDILGGLAGRVRLPWETSESAPQLSASLAGLHGMVMDCLQRNPRRRPTAEAVKEALYVAGR